MLTHAIGLIQDIQLTCFAAVFVLMAVIDRGNVSLRWLAGAYVAGFCGAAFDWASPVLPDWLSITFSTLAAPVGYACLHAGFAAFVRRGARTRWVSVAMLAISLPLYLKWSIGQHLEQIDRITTLADLCLAVQTALTAWLLLSTRDEETAWPRRVTGVFLIAYSAVEFARVIVFLSAGQAPGRIYPGVELASGIVYVVSCSVLPLAFIWMMNVRLHAHMARQMTTDPLTELLNRRGLEHAGDVELARYLRKGLRGTAPEFAVVLADVDHFKQLNDAFGHAGGDSVLREAATLFRGMVRETDVVGRLGGEEFVLILPETRASEAMMLVERLRQHIELHDFSTGVARTRITVSFGVTASGARRNISWTTLLAEADTALYAAKRAGRNACRLHSAQPAAPGDPREPSFETA